MNQVHLSLRNANLKQLMHLASKTVQSIATRRVAALSLQRAIRPRLAAVNLDDDSFFFHKFFLFCTSCDV